MYHWAVQVVAELFHNGPGSFFVSPWIHFHGALLQGIFFCFGTKIVSACQRKNDGNFHEKRGRIVSLSLPHNPLYMFGLLDVG